MSVSVTAGAKDVVFLDRLVRGVVSRDVTDVPLRVKALEVVRFISLIVATFVHQYH
jgi:hypothetical protein